MIDPRRRVVAALLENGESLAAYEIAEWTEIKDAEALVASMEKAGEIAWDGCYRRNDGYHKTYKPTELGIANHSDVRFREQERRCLCCQHLFKSQHAGNRICASCVQDDVA